MARGKKCPKCEEGAADWLLTYGDMTTLLLTFFIMMFTTAEVDGSELKMILAAFQGLGQFQGGNTLQAGKLAELGHSIMALPSAERGRALDEARKAAISIFQPETLSKKVRVTPSERGLVISLAADSFFDRATAEVNIEEARETLRKISSFLGSEYVADRHFEIQGHTDSIPTDPDSEWTTNWELSTARATNVLHYLVDFGVNEEQFRVTGFADTEPLMSNETEDGRAYNRRVDIIILAEGHL